jgi:hypothetical protein
MAVICGVGVAVSKPNKTPAPKEETPVKAEKRRKKSE